MKGVQIGKAAQQTGLSVDTIRFYEKEGLLMEPPRSEGGFRLYTARSIEHLQFIRKAQELGFSLSEIRELMLIQDERTEACAHVRDLIAQRLEAVRQKIRNLTTLQEHLEEALTKCSRALKDDAAGPQHECCPVLESIAHGITSKEKGDNAG
ncbi:MAG: heavy metal-responsive transcriptional regulator [Acidobacteria bacterium]|nr:heavy metal-responsive transcriptional regulator [Acidobacteriota bacterium]